MTTEWPVKPLAEVCEIQPLKSEARRRLSQSDRVSFVPMEDLGIGQKFLTPTKDRALSEVAASYTYFANGDILLAKITPCFENGKLGIAQDLTNGVGFGSSEYIVFRPSSRIEKDWLYYFLSREDFRIDGAKHMGGAVGHRRVSKDFIEGCSIPVPSLEEQRRIVAKLDEAFAAIAKAKENAEKNVANARAIFESELNAIFSATDSEWPRKPLGETCLNLDSMRVPVTKSSRVSGEVPYYGASGVVDYVKDHIFDEDLLLVSEDGANLLARTYPIAFSISGKSWVNNHAHVLRFDDSATQKFIELYLNSISLKPYVSGMAQPKLNQKALNAIPVPFPLLEIRKEVVAKLNDLEPCTRDMQEIYQHKIAELDVLEQSLLHHAFTGQL